VLSFAEGQEEGVVKYGPNNAVVVAAELADFAQGKLLFSFPSAILRLNGS